MAKEDDVPTSGEVLTRLAQLEHAVRILARRELRRPRDLDPTLRDRDDVELRVLRGFEERVR